MTIQLGPVALNVPRIAGIVERPLAPEELAGLRTSGVSILEFRADAFVGGLDALLEYLSRDQGLQNFGRLGTIRVDYPADTPLHSPEPATFESRRIRAFTKLLPLVDAIDVEVESPERDALTELARDADRRVVLSSHDFTKTPSPERFAAIVAEAERLQPDILKLAVFAHSPADLQRVLEFTRECSLPGLVTIAMGEYGLISRIAAPFFGSLISYGFLDQANAPGQLSAAELHAEFLRYHPDYRRDFEQRRGS